jgi:biofilm PGA synthesis protein PgaD
MSDAPPIENRDDLRSFLRNTTEWSFTVVMWGLWIYLFLPLLSLVLWIIGMPYIFKTILTEDVLRQMIGLLTRMGWAVVIIFIVLRGWGFYNYHMFGKKNRRKKHPEVTAEQMGRHFGVNIEDVKALQERKEITWSGLYDDIQRDEEK